MFFTTLLYFSLMVAFLSAVFLVVSPAAGYLFLLMSKPIIDTSFYKPLIFGLSLTKIVGAVIPLIVLVHVAFARRERRLQEMPMKGVWILFSVYVTFFSMVIIYNEGIKDGVEVFFRHINMFCGYYLMQALYRNKEDIKRLLKILILSGVFPMASVIYQVVTGVHWEQQGIMQIGDLTRSAGLYFHVMTARYYAYQSLVAMLLYTSIYARKGVINLILFLYGMAAVFVIISTYSKAGFVTLALMILIWVFFQKKYKLMLLMLATSAVMLPFFIGQILSALHTIFFLDVVSIGRAEGLLRGRLQLWTMLSEEWSRLSLIARIFSSGTVMTGAHNDYIQMLFHGGVVGLVIYLVLLATTGIKILKNLLEKVDPLATAALILYLSWLIDTVGLVPSGYPHYSWLVWGIIGLSFKQRQIERDDRRRMAAQPVGELLKKS